MAIFTVARYAVRPEARAAAEAAMHAYATYVRGELPGATWTTYRDPHAPGSYLALGRADDRATDDRQRAAPGTAAFAASLAPLLTSPAERTAYELVTSSDLAPRPRADRPPRGGASRPRRR